MKKELEKIRDQQKSSWNEFSVMWEKWDDLLMKSLGPMADETMNLLNVKDTDTVLDIASGTGEPGLTIAKRLKNGKVIITDISESMLEIARENAAEKGIKNIEIRVCDACELPFGDNTFDAISCRLGFMFFPDMLLAAKEMYRVLKSGGKIVASVWNLPERNFWATAISAAVIKNMQLSPPPPEAPGLFRCAKSGMMQNLFQQAEFKSTYGKEVALHINFDSIDRYWTMVTEVTPPLVSALNKADDAMKEKIKNEVYQAIGKRYPDGNISMEANALIIVGNK